jgi:F-type H+-transporting ATPase subunit b
MMEFISVWLPRAALAAHEEAESFSLVSVHPGTVIWTIIIFVILVLLLGKLLWKPMLRAVDEREKKIRTALESAEQARAQAEQAIAEQKKLLEQQRQQVQQLLAHAREEARAASEQLLEKTRREAAEIIARARRQVEEEKNSALRELRAYAVDLALASAGHLLGKSLDDAAHRQIVQQYLDNLPRELSQTH